MELPWLFFLILLIPFLIYQGIRLASRDPVKHCPVYRDKENGGCAHVDGFLCDMKTCTSIKIHLDKKESK